MTTLLALLRCPIDPDREATLTRDGQTLVCSGCPVRFPVKHGLPVLVPDEAPAPPGVRSREHLPCVRGRPAASLTPAAACPSSPGRSAISTRPTTYTPATTAHACAVVVVEGGEQVRHLQVADRGDDPPEVEPEPLAGRPHRGREQFRQVQRQPPVERRRDAARAARPTARTPCRTRCSAGRSRPSSPATARTAPRTPAAGRTQPPSTAPTTQPSAAPSDETICMHRPGVRVASPPGSLPTHRYIHISPAQVPSSGTPLSPAARSIRPSVAPPRRRRQPAPAQVAAGRVQVAEDDDHQPDQRDPTSRTGERPRSHGPQRDHAAGGGGPDEHAEQVAARPVRRRPGLLLLRPLLGLGHEQPDEAASAAPAPPRRASAAASCRWPSGRRPSRRAARPTRASPGVSPPTSVEPERDHAAEQVAEVAERPDPARRARPASAFGHTSMTRATPSAHSPPMPEGAEEPQHGELPRRRRRRAEPAAQRVEQHADASWPGRGRSCRRASRRGRRRSPPRRGTRR